VRFLVGPEDVELPELTVGEVQLRCETIPWSVCPGLPRVQHASNLPEVVV
jgi:hypothetical protein